VASDPVISLAFLAVGVATQAGALHFARRPIRLLRAGGSARGMVLDNEEAMMQMGRGPASKFYFPLIEFTTTQGERIRFTSATGRASALAKGNEVPVLYDPASPNEAELATFKTLWLVPTIMAAFGLPFLAAGLIGLL
jgi:hypothetical protein